MYNQQAYPTFALIPGVMPDGFGGYPPSAVKPDNRDLGDPPTQEVLAWTPLQTVQPPSYWALHGPPYEVETPRNLVKGEEEAENKSYTVLPSALYYPRYLDNSSWHGSPQKSISIPDSSMDTSRESRSRSPPEESAAANMESSSASTEEVAKEGDAAANIERSSASTEEVAKEGDAAAAVSSPPADDEALSGDGEEKPETVSEMEKFVKEMRCRRAALGYTQADVGLALGIVNGMMFSQTTISRFEAFQLSFKNMCKLKTLLINWLEATEKDENLEKKMSSEQALLSQCPKRRVRTIINKKVKMSLEAYFLIKARPVTAEIAQIARDLKTDPHVVRVWFCNRRQKERKFICDERRGEPYGVQHMFHPPMQASPLPQETTYMAPPSGSPAAVYSPDLRPKNGAFVPHTVPYEKPAGI